MENNYKAVVVRLKEIRKHSNADRLACTNIFGNNIIVGLDAKEGDLGLYFPVGAQIGVEFAAANDLIRRKDEEGKPAGGMFDNNRKVRAQTLRGEESAGFWCPISYFEKFCDHCDIRHDLDFEGTKEEQEIGEVGKYTISKKYIPVGGMARNSGTGAKKRQPKVERIVDGQFNFHFNTAQLGKNTHKINPDDTISVTWKLHGTSAITSNCLVRRPLTIREKVLKGVGKLIGYKLQNPVTHDYIFSSRKVIKNNDMNKDKANTSFYSTDVHSDSGKMFVGKLHKGETVYYEVVGYDGNGRFIQKEYDYGCTYGEFAVYVYRITQTNSDGIVTELQWNQVKERCMQIGINYMPEIYYGRAGDLFEISEETHWNQEFFNNLKETYVFDQDSIFCKNKVTEEGIVVRKEGLSIESFKLKSFKFLKMESEQSDKGEVDIETQESQEDDVDNNSVSVTADMEAV